MNNNHYKIVHICMCDPYAENWSYHRNISSIQNAIDGHEVYVLTTRYTMNKDGEGVYTDEEPYINEHGVKVIRFDDKIIHNRIIQSRLRFVKGLYNSLLDISPDIIMIHNPQFMSIFDVTKYKKKYPEVTLLVDSHADYSVSGRNIISKYLLNGLYSKTIIKRTIKYYDKLYFITKQTKDFFEELFTRNLPENTIIPLGSQYYPPEEKYKNRMHIRTKLEIKDDELLLVHSGKLDARKKTKDLLIAFSQVPELKAKLLIFGSVPEDMQEILHPLFNSDKRVSYCGWVDSIELAKYLCAADIYMQPGMHSITLQNALSCGTPALVSPNTSYEDYFDNWQFVGGSIQDLVDFFVDLSHNKYNLNEMSNSAYRTASKYYDSRIFARDMYATHEARKKMRSN